MKRILVIEDDPAIALSLTDSLRESHYDVLAAGDGLRGSAMAKRGRIDLIILDLMLPGKPGEEICRDLRAEGFPAPILMLTSRTEEADKIVGLELGADDYMTKPFSLRELHARVHALLRRHGGVAAEPEEYVFGEVTLDLRRQSATRGGRPLGLSVKEFDILRYMIRREGEVVTRDMLLDNVWGYESIPVTRTVDNFILSLRKKIEPAPGAPVHILTVHTRGYRFVP
jgi:two-component system alkaline phosphatase synthesis response regulator PhoP